MFLRGKISVSASVGKSLAKKCFNFSLKRFKDARLKNYKYNCYNYNYVSRSFKWLSILYFIKGLFIKAFMSRLLAFSNFFFKQKVCSSA